MSTLDIIIGIGLAIGLIRGLMTGAVRQALGLAGTILAVILGLEFMRPVGGVIGSALGLPESFYSPVGFLAIFLGLELAFFFIIRAVEAAIKVLKLSVVNRGLGGAFGAAKAVLMFSILFLVLGLFNVPEEENRRTSLLYGPVAGAFPSVWDFVAEHFPYVRTLSQKFTPPAPEAMGDGGWGMEDGGWRMDDG